MEMEYRRLGSSGLKLSALSFGAWVTFGNQVDDRVADECLTIAYEAGVNFFDNAEVYAGGRAESVMGEILARKNWRRSSYVVSTKFYWGIHDRPNEMDSLNRKRLMEGINGSLQRLKLDYVDLIFCHRPDPETPVEETVWAMHDIITQGKALYWGTSEWSADRIREAYEVAEKYRLHKPQMEQPQYNMFDRENMERNLKPLYALGLGATVWSPLASGLLTGKYDQGIPKGSRAMLRGYEWLREELESEEGQRRIGKVRKLRPLAEELGCTLAQLALAWCLKNPDVSTVITGASRKEQVVENLKALEVAARLTPEVMERTEGILDNRP